MATAAPDTLSRVNVPPQDFKTKIQAAEKKFEEISHDAGAKVGAMASNLVHAANEYAKSSRHYVEENPGKSVAIAAAAGLVAGSLITLVMRRRK
ncbi:MAG: hypothetical protein A2Z20_01570 [Bdellovibrionales bacterium RBG_16_40_8]|nr:MAG: hypothetical protein A2Z20_01570 [Bdellovibrionales bacterium RBG_16_40_8]